MRCSCLVAGWVTVVAALTLASCNGDDPAAPIPDTGNYTISLAYLNKNGLSTARTISLSLTYASSDSIAGTVSGEMVQSGPILFGARQAGDYLFYVPTPFSQFFIVRANGIPGPCSGHFFYDFGDTSGPYTRCTIEAASG